MSTSLPRILVLAAPASSSGKTTVTLALLASLVRRGLWVQSFKVGPDCIDPALHAAVTGRPAFNLDAWIYGRDACRAIVAGALARSPGPDVLVVEGVMGLFDGVSGLSEEGSTAQMAKWLGAPVALVVDARAQGRSVAAQVNGFAGFDPDLDLPFVICNKTGSDRHREMLAQALQSGCPGVRLLGCLPRCRDIELPSRHLGLHTAAEGALSPALAEALADWLEQAVDLDALLAALPEYDPGPEPRANRPGLPKARIAVARDKAFCFHTAGNEERLIQAGAELVFFSPLKDRDLPPGIDGLILGGGYPELYAAELSANASMLGAVRAFAASVRPVWAACGGFMYLMERLVDQEGRSHAMAGLFPFTAAMRDRLQALGYRQVRLGGHCLRGHEFRYSALVDENRERAAKLSVAGLCDAAGKDLGAGVFRAPGLNGLSRCYGTYMHVHLGSAPGAAEEFVRLCLQRNDPHG